MAACSPPTCSWSAPDRPAWPPRSPHCGTARRCSSSNAAPAPRPSRGPPASAPAPWRSSAQWGLAAAVRAGGVDCEPRIAVRHTLAAEPLVDVPFSAPPIREALAVEPGLPGRLPAGPHRAAAGRGGAPARRGGAVRHRAHRPADRRRRTGCGPSSVGGGRVRARFVVGADGPRSTVRAALGIGWSGSACSASSSSCCSGRPRAAARAPSARAELGPAPGRRRGAAAGRRRALGVRAPVVPGARREPGRLHASAASSCCGPPPGCRTCSRSCSVRARSRWPPSWPRATGAGPGFLVGDAAHRMTPGRRDRA